MGFTKLDGVASATWVVITLLNLVFAGWDGRLNLTFGVGTIDGAGSTRKGLTAEANLLGLACFLLLVVRTRQAIDELQAQRRSRQPPSMILRFIRKTSRSVIMAGVITVGVVLLFSLVIGWATSTIRLKGEDTTAWCSKQLGIQDGGCVCNYTTEGTRHRAYQEEPAPTPRQSGSDSSAHCRTQSYPQGDPQSGPAGPTGGFPGWSSQPFDEATVPRPPGSWQQAWLVRAVLCLWHCSSVIAGAIRQLLFVVTAILMVLKELEFRWSMIARQVPMPPAMAGPIAMTLVVMIMLVVTIAYLVLSFLFQAGPVISIIVTAVILSVALFCCGYGLSVLGVCTQVGLGIGVALFRKARSVVLKIWSLPGSAMRELRSLLAVFFFGWPPEEPMGRQPDAASANNADAGGAGFFLASGGQPAAGHPDASEPQELPDVAEMQQQEPVQARGIIDMHLTGRVHPHLYNDDSASPLKPVLVHEAEQLCNDHAQGMPSSAREVQDASNDAAAAPAEGSSGLGDYAAPDAPSPNDLITPDDMAPTPQDQSVDPRIDMDSPGSPANESAPRNDVNDILSQLTDDVVGEVGPSGQPASVQLSGDADQPTRATFNRLPSRSVHHQEPQELPTAEQGPTVSSGRNLSPAVLFMLIFTLGRASMQPIPGIDVASHMEDASVSEVDSVLEDGASNDNGIADANSREADGDGCSNGTHSLATGDDAGVKQGMMEGEGITAAERMTGHDAANGDAEEANVTGLDGQLIGEGFNEASAAELAASDSSFNAALANTADSSSTAAASAGGPQRSASPPKGKGPPAPAGGAQGLIPAEGVHPALQGPMPEDCEELGAETSKKKKMLTLPSKIIRRTATALRIKPCAFDDQTSQAAPGSGRIINMQAQATAPVQISTQNASATLPPSNANAASPVGAADSEADQERKVVAKFRRKLLAKGNKLRRFISRSKST